MVAFKAMLELMQDTGMVMDGITVGANTDKHYQLVYNPYMNGGEYEAVKLPATEDGLYYEFPNVDELLDWLAEEEILIDVSYEEEEEEDLDQLECIQEKCQGCTMATECGYEEPKTIESMAKMIQEKFDLSTVGMWMTEPVENTIKEMQRLVIGEPDDEECYELDQYDVFDQVFWLAMYNASKEGK